MMVLLSLLIYRTRGWISILYLQIDAISPWAVVFTTVDDDKNITQILVGFIEYPCLRYTGHKRSGVVIWVLFGVGKAYIMTDCREIVRK